MQNPGAVVALTATFAIYALVAARLERVSVTAPMVFLLAGLLLGPHVTGVLTFPTLENGAILTFTENHARAPAVRGRVDHRAQTS